MVNYFKNYWLKAFDFKGKASRKEYWMTFLTMTVFEIILLIIIGIVFPFQYKLTLDKGIVLTGSPIGFWIERIYSYATIIPSFSIVIRRLHDIGKSGWHFLMVLIPIAGPIIILVYLCTKGVDTDTQSTNVVSAAPVSQEPVAAPVSQEPVAAPAEPTVVPTQDVAPTVEPTVVPTADQTENPVDTNNTNI